jgi:pimeloyl-ACP methyl ester carboxylesterase
VRFREGFSGGVVLLAWCLLAPATWAASLCGPDGLQASGSIYRICMPAPGEHNGDLVIWAHGFQDAGTPVQIPEDQLVVGGISIPEVINTLGFGFATNSYSKTGLAVRQGMADILDLIDIYTAEHGAPTRVYLTGASEGGLITTLLVEQHPDKFTGGLAACGPIGDFPYQINYFGDARLIFEVYFPGLIPGDPFNPSPELADNWESFYAQVVKPAVFDPANRTKLRQWAKVAKLPYNAGDFLNTVEVSVADVLRYAVVNARDAAMTLGGFPYDNRDRIYTGSENDFLLNLLVPRLRADGTALTEMRTRYNTRGQLAVPLVTLHTTRDQQVPQPHQVFYTLKTLSTGDFLTLHVPLTVDRFEHCNFEAAEVLVSFGLLLQATGFPLPAGDIAAVVPDESQAQFKALAEEHGLK